MKCSACTNNECEGKYEKRGKCLGEKENITCTCICQVTRTAAYVASGASVGSGIIAAAAGVGLTVAASSFIALLSGTAIVGAGASLVLSPIQKYISSECITAKDSLKEAALGATIGAITGPIGAAGSAYANGASILGKFGIRAVAGSTAGAVSGAVSEGARKARGERVTTGSLAKSVAMGAVVGIVGGASSQLANSLSSGIANEVGQAATRITVQGASAAVTDASIQLYQNGTIDKQQLLLNTTGQLTVATTAEVSSSMAQRTSTYNNKINNEKINNSNLSPEEAQKVKTIISETNSLKDRGLESGKKIGNNNIHVLDRDRAGQVAGDIGPRAENGGRGAGRVILEKVKGKYVYVDHTRDHDYKGCKATIANTIPNPLDSALRADQINANILNNIENFDECNESNDEVDNENKKEK